MSSREWIFRVRDILNSIEKIERYVDGMTLESVCDSGFVAFQDYFGRFSTQIAGVICWKSILPPRFGSKIGSKEPEKRQKLNHRQTLSKL